MEEKIDPQMAQIAQIKAPDHVLPGEAIRLYGNTQSLECQHRNVCRRREWRPEHGRADREEIVEVPGQRLLLRRARDPS